MGLAWSRELVYALPVARSIVLGVILAAALAGSAVRAEQTIEILTPPEEQHIEVLSPGDDAGPGVDAVAIDAGRVQDVGVQEPPSPTAKAASTAGKVVLSVASAVVSLAAMAATLLLL